MLAARCTGTGADLVVEVTGGQGATMRIKNGETTARMSFDGYDEQDVELRGITLDDRSSVLNKDKYKPAITWGARGFTASDRYIIDPPAEWATSGHISLNFQATCI